MVAGKEDMEVAAVVCLGYPLKVALSLSPLCCKFAVHVQTNLMQNGLCV